MRKAIYKSVIYILGLSGCLATSNLFAEQSKLLPAQGNAKLIPNQYIVVLNDQASAYSMSSADFVAMESSRLANRVGAEVLYNYKVALSGFVVKATTEQLKLIAQDASIDYIEQDQMMSINGTQSPATWGLDRVDQRKLPLNNTYVHDGAGKGVNAYIIDTGIRRNHKEFGRRANHGFTAINDGRGSDDCNGHGTHVAGTVGGRTYGVAKRVKLFSVRVLACNGSGSNSGVIAGVDYVANNGKKPAVANMSLGGGNSNALDNAVRHAINQGIFFAVAAGNDNANACNGSPNRVREAATVAASTRSDQRANFSNYGACIDIFAPGQSITSAWINGSNSSNTISGTSMAAPHVAGAAVLFLQKNRNAAPAKVFRNLRRRSTQDVLSDTRGSTNRLLYTR